MKEAPRSTRHLDPEEFFLLALPPAGEPEALPPHLSACADCARQLGEWKKAGRALAAGGEGPPEDFERSVMAKVRGLRTPRSHRLRRRAAAGLAAAASLLLAFWVGMRVGRPGPPPAASADSGMSPADRRDDALLRDVSRLLSGEEDGSWNELAPLPGSAGGES